MSFGDIYYTCKKLCLVVDKVVPSTTLHVAISLYRMASKCVNSSVIEINEKGYGHAGLISVIGLES